MIIDLHNIAMKLGILKCLCQSTRSPFRTRKGYWSWIGQTNCQSRRTLSTMSSDPGHGTYTYCHSQTIDQSLSAKTFGTVNETFPSRMLKPSARTTRAYLELIDVSQDILHWSHSPGSSTSPFLRMIKPFPLVICFGGLDVSQVTVTRWPLVQTVPAWGSKIRGTYTSRLSRGAAWTTKEPKSPNKVRKKAKRFIV